MCLMEFHKRFFLNKGNREVFQESSAKTPKLQGSTLKQTHIIVLELAVLHYKNVNGVSCYIGVTLQVFICLN